MLTIEKDEIKTQKREEQKRGTNQCFNTREKILKKRKRKQIFEKGGARNRKKRKNYQEERH